MMIGLFQAESTLAQSDHVVAYSIVNAKEIPTSLTGTQGNAEQGRQLYFDREATGCSGCHGSPGGPGAQPNAEGADAPPLSGVAGRLTQGVMRLWLVAPTVIRPDTAMPGYYTVGQRDDPTDPRFGEPRLSASEIEDILAYLMKQREP